MTIVESYQKEAVERLEKGELNSYESDFIEQIRDYSKKRIEKIIKQTILVFTQNCRG